MIFKIFAFFLFFIIKKSVTNDRFYIPVANIVYNKDNECTDFCSIGPVLLKKQFSLFGESFNSINIHSNGLINGAFDSNRATSINILNINTRECLIYFNTIYEPRKLSMLSTLVNRIPGHENFEANWGFYVFWDRIYTKKFKNFFQLILLSDNLNNFVIFNYIQVDSSIKVFNSGFSSSKGLNYTNKTIKDLIENSNIGYKGIYVYHVDKVKNFSPLTRLDVLLVISVVCLFIILNIFYF